MHDSFLRHYKNRDWMKAIILLDEIIENKSPILYYYKVMRERVIELQNNDPGEDWDQVYRATSK